jgi:hypothetical protein
MIPEDGNYYPWQLELWAWDKAEREKRGGATKYADPNAPKAKLSDVLRCMEEACARPEIWDRYVEMAAQKERGVEVSDDDGNELAAFMGLFHAWFRMKNDLDHYDFQAFSSVQRLVARLANGSLQRADFEGMKAVLGPWGWEDDLADPGQSLRSAQ